MLDELGDDEKAGGEYLTKTLLLAPPADSKGLSIGPTQPSSLSDDEVEDDYLTFSSVEASLGVGATVRAIGTHSELLSEIFVILEHR